MEKRMAEIKNRKVEIRGLLEGKEAVDLYAIKTELEALEIEERGIKEKMEVAEKINLGQEEVRTIQKPVEERGMNNMNTEFTVESKEYRSAFLNKVRGIALNEIEQRAYSNIATVGAELVPTQTANKIIDKVKQLAPVLNEVELLHVSGNVKFAVEDTTADATLHTENGNITGAADTLKEVTLGSYEITKLIQVSKTVATMSIDAFEGWLVSKLAEMLARKIENYLINGTGSSEPMGVEKANTWDATNSVTVAKASSLTAVNVQTLVGLLNGGYDANAKFLMSKKTLFTDFMPLQDNSKNSIVKSEGNSYYIYGYPVMISDYVTIHEAYLGDFKKICANLAEDINVVSQFDINTNSYKYLGACQFDSKVALGEAFVKLVKATV